LKLFAGSALVLSALAVVVTTIHWPLAGDSALMHYICFLSKHGYVPYRTIQDQNLPGSYLPDWILQSLFGASSLAWRLYDFGLVAAISASMFFIARRPGRFGALWASCLLVLIHARDGMREAGERDLFAAAILIAGVAAFLWAKRSHRVAPAFLFGLAVGLALTVKPTFLFFGLLPVVDQLLAPDERALFLRRCAVVLAGIACPLLGCILWLASLHSLKNFAYTLEVLAPYHASLGHATWEFLLYNSVSPMRVLLLVWVAIHVLVRMGPTRFQLRSMVDPVLRRTLLYCAFAGWLSYLVQRKAYLYQRDPFLVFLLLLIALDLNGFLSLLSEKRSPQWLSAVALLWTAVVFAPVSVWKVARYQSPDAAFQAELSGDLQLIDTRDQLGPLSGKVQCLDTIAGCIDTLEQLQLVQASGQIYDEYLFQPSSRGVISDSRSFFAQELQTNPPLIFIVTASLFPSGPGGYDKLAQWPRFDDWLNQHYALAVERTPTRGYRSMGRPVVPASYRVYVRRDVKRRPPGEQAIVAR
jgi:hypothetical protein